MAATDQQLLQDDRNQLAIVQRWRGVIDTQMHFNDMLMRTRSIGLSMVIAVYGAAIVSAGQYPDSSVTIFAYRLHVGVGPRSCCSCSTPCRFWSDWRFSPD